MSQQERAARYSDLFEESHAHASDCSLCPICATIGVVRKTRPEVLDHLAAAARELIIAAGIMLEEAGNSIGKDDADPSAGGRVTDSGKVRRIDVG